MRKLDGQIARGEPPQRAAAGAARAGSPLLRRRREVHQLPQAGDGVLEAHRARVGLADAGRGRKAERLQVRRLPRHRLRRGRRHQPGPHRSPARTCSARSATAPARPTSPARGWRSRSRSPAPPPPAPAPRCHTEQHSDTFQYEAYLRDIIGPGHGGAARAKLGDGPDGPRPPQRRAGQGQGRRQTQDVARGQRATSPDSNLSRRSGSMLPPVTTTTVRRPRIRLASSSRIASAGAAEASHRIPRVR